MLAGYFQSHTLADLPGLDQESIDAREALDDVVGFVGSGAKINAVGAFAADATLARDLVAAMTPPAAVPEAKPPDLEKVPDDPLCPVQASP